MREYAQFKQTSWSVPQATAAVIGINKLDWKDSSSVPPGSEVQQYMTDMKYDIIPIKNRNDNYHAYYRTEQWANFSIIQRAEITLDDELYYLSHVRDIIRLFSEKRRNYFFLTNYSEVLGLVSIAHLNSREVFNYLYGRLSNLERLVGNFLSRTIGSERIIKHLESPHFKSRVGKCDETLQRYYSDVTGGVDANIVEYPYLLDLFGIVIMANQSEKFGYKSPDTLWSDAHEINKVRIAVAHPNRSLIAQPEDAKILWKAIQIEEKLTDKLEELTVSR